MPTLAKLLVASTQLTTSAASPLYTVGPNTKARISSGVATNTTGTNRTITVYLLPNAGTVGDSTTVIKTLSVPANSQTLLPWLSGQVLEVGGAIHALADSASAVTFRVSGDEIS